MILLLVCIIGFSYGSLGMWFAMDWLKEHWPVVAPVSQVQRRRWPPFLVIWLFWPVVLMMRYLDDVGYHWRQIWKFGR